MSATSAPDTSGVESQYRIGCHACSGIASIAARMRLSWRVVMENRTFSLRAVPITAREWNALSARTVSCPAAPAWRSRDTVSVRNDLALRAAPALPPRIREKITCPVSGRVASRG